MLQIKELSIFWKFYCKRYEIAGVPVPKPTNLCPYFWTAVFGFCLWLRYQVSLWKLFILAIVSTILSAFAEKAIGGTVPGLIIVTPLVLVWFSLLGTAILVLVLRITDFLKANPWVGGILFACSLIFFLGIIVYALATSEASFKVNMSEFFADFYADMKSILILAGYLLIGIFVLGIFQNISDRFRKVKVVTISVLLVAFLAGFVYLVIKLFLVPMFQFIGEHATVFGYVGTVLAVVGAVLLFRKKASGRLKENISNSFATLMAFAKAKKNRICPPVAAPAPLEEHTRE